MKGSDTAPSACELGATCAPLRRIAAVRVSTSRATMRGRRRHAFAGSEWRSRDDSIKGSLCVGSVRRFSGSAFTSPLHPASLKSDQPRISGQMEPSSVFAKISSASKTKRKSRSARSSPSGLRPPLRPPKKRRFAYDSLEREVSSKISDCAGAFPSPLAPPLQDRASDQPTRDADCRSDRGDGRDHEEGHGQSHRRAQEAVRRVAHRLQRGVPTRAGEAALIYSRGIFWRAELPRGRARPCDLAEFGPPSKQTMPAPDYLALSASVVIGARPDLGERKNGH